MSAKLKTVGMELIHANPYRLLHAYPWIEPKLDALQASIEDVGFWEGVIARPRTEGGYELAFGHHRIEAARRSGMNRAPIIVRDLTDEQMVKFMGRENGEDYKADFLTMLNTWEGAKDFSCTHEKDVNIARLLGWTKTDVSGYDKMTQVAQTCATAHSLIEAGLLERDDLADLSVRAVLDLCLPLNRELKSLEGDRKKHFEKSAPTEVVEKKVDDLKQTAARATKSTAQAVREGRVAPTAVRTTTSAKISEERTQKTGKVSPDFESVVQRMDYTVEKWLDGDATDLRIKEIVKVMPYLERHEDIRAVEALISTLYDAKSRIEKAAAKLDSALKDRPLSDIEQPKLEVVS